MKESGVAASKAALSNIALGGPHDDGTVNINARSGSGDTI